MVKKKRLAVVDTDFVAFGTCVKVCPFGAITIDRGMIATVNASKCVGCGKCAKICPAGVIHIAVQEAEALTKGELQ